MNVKTVMIKLSRVVVWLVYAWVTITVVMLSLAFFLLLFGANPDSGFVEWVYRSTERAMAPFRGIFEPIALTDQSVVEPSVLFAIVVYLLVAAGLSVAVNWLTQLVTADDHRQQLRARRTPAPVTPQVVHLAAGPLTANAVMTPDAGGMSINLRGAGLDPARVYAAWLEGTGGGRVTAVTFQPSPAGEVSISFRTPLLLAQNRAFGISLMPVPGEPGAVDLVAALLA
jgi:uncharacterized protein YggT (Ycf19 family)